MISAHEALERLREGNRRFVSGTQSHDTNPAHSPRPDPSSEQEPLAIILGCSDSRVPAEIVFDQGLGDLFVIRVAGNIVAPSLVGSIEFAAAKFGTRLVVVLGHSGCGVVLTALERIRQPRQALSPNLQAIVDQVRPTVEESLRTLQGQDQDSIVRHAVRANVRTSVAHLRDDSEILSSLIENNGLLVVGAEYCLDSGVVDFFDGEDAE